jgi:hypothetical protein
VTAPSTFLVFADRPSDSPHIERVWRCHSERDGTFLSVASSHCELVVTRHRGLVSLTLRGPETKVSRADCPADAEWIGIRLSLGTFMPSHPANVIRDRQDATLPSLTPRSFLLDGRAWEYPSVENAETFVARLVRAGFLANDSSVGRVLRGETPALTTRTAERHFRFATGMTHSTHRKIERARYATNLLKQGVSIADTVHEARYYDQAHLTRSLTLLIGETPARILRGERQLSFLYKTGERPPV